MTIASGLLAITLGLISYYKIEPRKLLAFNIDEIGLQINHYFKRKEALFSPLGFVLLIVAVVRLGTFCAVGLRRSIFDLEDPLTLIFVVDMLAFFNLVALWTLCVFVKIITQSAQALCPIFLGKAKAYGNAKKRTGA